MGITYNKQFTSKDRRIVTRGPSDNQRKQAIPAVTETSPTLAGELMAQIVKLQKQLISKPVSEGMYTPEQVDEEILKAIKTETVGLVTKNEVLENKNKELTKNHKKEIASLKELIKNKEEMIQQLRENHSVGVDENKLTALLSEATKKIEDMAMSSHGLSQDSIDTDRPKMETVFVDPIEKEEHIETHINIEEISVNKKEQMEMKVDKLKNLMGKLSTKKD